jgi:hypothetical protein
MIASWKLSSFSFRKRKEKQCVCNVSLSSLRVNIGPVEKRYYYSKFVFVSLGIQHATRVRRIGICRLSYSMIFFHIISFTAPFFKKKKSR